MVGGLAVLAAAFSAPADARSVDIELVIAVDSSTSVDFDEFNLQVRGLAAAFRDPTVVAAIADGPRGAISVAVFEWADPASQMLAVPWTVIDGPATANAFARRVDGMTRQVPRGGTSIAGALAFASVLFQNNPHPGDRQVIDLTADGRNNQGPAVDQLRDLLVARGITINGMVILNDDAVLDGYFEDRVIGGPDAFVEAAADYTDYAKAIRR
ncbi:MAG: DUF1194 domain-containing protein, partial [Pseudomonadota bacterium]|nr:DUF1194 domain-containing protein [Pseudomonadota bacterium]